MPMVAQKPPYTLFILDDNCPQSPREDRDNFGKMICFHRRHSLGDEHDHNEPMDFLRELLFNKYAYDPDSNYGNPVYDYIKNGNAKEARLEYNRSTREWELLENNYWSTGNDWYQSSSYPASQKGKDVPDWFLDECLSTLRISELIELAEQIKDTVILPLYLYDHSGITMNTRGFSCSWDSGQVGWIYADSETIKKEYDAVTPETINRAKNLLEAEVEDYDYYLTGQCYGFQLYKGDEIIESCWGFQGDISDVSKQVQEYLPDDCKDIVESLEHEYDIDEDDYLEQTLEMEGEEENDIEM
jgi:hypothetical protein